MDNMSQSDEERAASLELTLRDVLTQHGPLFQEAPTAHSQPSATSGRAHFGSYYGVYSAMAQAHA